MKDQQRDTNISKLISVYMMIDGLTFPQTPKLLQQTRDMKK